MVRVIRGIRVNRVIRVIRVVVELTTTIVAAAAGLWRRLQ